MPDARLPFPQALPQLGSDRAPWREQACLFLALSRFRPAVHLPTLPRLGLKRVQRSRAFSARGARQLH